MTREQAIQTLKEYRNCLFGTLAEPIDMAIKALEREISKSKIKKLCYMTPKEVKDTIDIYTDNEVSRIILYHSFLNGAIVPNIIACTFQSEEKVKKTIRDFEKYVLSKE